MKIRTGFVSNSSSTSFLIITRDDLNEHDFFALMGVAEDSPIADLFRQFYEDVVQNIGSEVDYSTADDEVPAEEWFQDGGADLTQHMIARLRVAKSQGLKAYFGSLDSETNNVQTFFCTDSFEVENEKIYFNGLECVW